MTEMASKEPRLPSTLLERGSEPHQRLTSFGFLNEDDEEEQRRKRSHDQPYGITSILLSGLKNVFSGASDHGDVRSIASSSAHTLDDPVLSEGPASQATRQALKASSGVSKPTQRSAEISAPKQEDVPPSMVGRSGTAAASSPTSPLVLSQGPTLTSAANHARGLPAPSAHSSLSASLASRIFPPALRTPELAPAVVSTAPLHVVSHHHTGRNGGLAPGHDLDADSVNTGDDLNRPLWQAQKGGSAAGSASFEGPGAWMSIPGFPLSRDLLLDDAQSIKSVNTKRHGSEASFDQSPSEPNSISTSAEAFRRLTLQGRGPQSKDWWIPDASVRDCSSCGSPFTVARRRHHCRCCGQIFCAKCASNLLPGSKFGLTGVVRVCVLCTGMLKEYERARAGQRSARTHHRDSDGRVRSGLISAPLEAAVGDTPQGRFAANALFGATALGREIPSNDSTNSLLNHLSSNEDLSSAMKDMPESRISEANEAPAPFRKGLGEEDPINEVGETTVDQSGEDLQLNDSNVERPSSSVDGSVVNRISSPMTAPAHSSIQFPATSDGAQEVNSPTRREANAVLGDARGRLTSDAALSADHRARLISDAAIRAFRRSRLKSRLGREALHGAARDENFLTGLGPRAESRLGDNAHEALTEHSHDYLRRLCLQSLQRAGVPDYLHWCEVLLPLACKVVERIKPVSHTDGKSMMGVRKYVKIKRIAGGRSDECHLQSGYICSRNVASKAMLRRLPMVNARVVLLAFPLTAVKGDAHYISFEMLSASEKELTRILVARILSLRPHILIVKDQVSRLALELLEGAGVIVVSKVPESSMTAIARVTQAEVVTSADRLALRPRSGRCGSFDVKTFHAGQHATKRKSFLIFSGTPKQHGCSIVLRGGGPDLLGRVKVVLELCIMAAHNLRVEEALRETAVSLLPRPSTTDDKADREELFDLSAVSPPGIDSSVSDALQNFENTLLSISADVRIPPPHPLVRLRQEFLALEKLKSEMESEDGGAPAEASSPHTLEDKNSVKKSDDGATESHNDFDEKADSSVSTLASVGDIEPQVLKALPTSEELSLRTRYALARARHDLDAAFAADILEDATQDTPFAHQRLTCLYASVSSATLRPCVGPKIQTVDFYGSDDRTLADYLEARCAASSQTCDARACGLQRILHYDAYVHNNVRLQVFCERFVCPIAGQENSLLTWEYCKACESATPVSIVQDEAKAYSWMKYLEAYFTTPNKCVSECSHVALTDRIRYFAYKNLAYRIHVELIHPFDVVVPGLRLFMRPDIQGRLKSEETIWLGRRTDSYFHSVSARIDALEHEIGLGKDGAATTAKYSPQIWELRQQAVQGRQEVNTLMLASGKGSPPTLNQVRRRLQDVVVTIDRLFANLEKMALPKERDIRRLTTHHLSRLFVEEEAREAAAVGSAVDKPSDTTSNAKEMQHEGLPSASTADTTPDVASEGLPSNPSESSVAALARIADSAALGLAPELDFSSLSHTTTPSASGTATPVARPSQRSSRVLTSTSGEPSQSAGAHGANDDSDGNSSPTAQFQALVRPKPKKSVSAPKQVPAQRQADSSCTEAGEVTDASPLVSSLISRFESNLAAQEPPARKVRAADTSKPAPSKSPQLITSDSESRPSRRPRSPAPRIKRQGALASALGHSASTSQVPTAKSSGTSKERMAPPPSSFRRPQSRTGRTSESESDAVSSRGVRNFSMTKLAAPAPSHTRANVSSRGSTERGDSGNERLASSSRSSSRPARPPSRVPVPTSNTRNRVSTIARHFDRINRQAEREREKQKRALALRARRALPISASTARVAEYTSVSAAFESDESSSEDDDDGVDADEGESGRPSATEEDESDSGAEGDEDEGPSSREKEASEATLKGVDALDEVVPEASKEVVKAASHLPQAPFGESFVNAVEKGSLLKTISSLWASRPGAALPLLEYPLTGEQHLFADSRVLLREDEPSSTIAFTLVSRQYQDRLHGLGQGLPGEAGAESIETSLRRPEGVHLRFDFESGSSRFHCRILFAEQFHALRRCCGCQESLVESLARCVKWDSSGGKSGMTFLKTRDDRLVLKQLSSAELSSFSSFAPHYFAHMAECLMHGKPTTLAKIFGLFRISHRNQASGKSYKLDVVVMENLFYGRQCSRIFDLKGSMRNRYVKETGAAGEVLLDENLVEISLQKPLYVRESSKALLRSALRHDSSFLAEMNIMDYSVIVGVDANDPNNRELVVGIIDFLRSYTWDKRVETFVKEQSSLLGAAKGELPTVITPRQYASRFLSFLDGMLLVSPDSWYHHIEDGRRPATL